MANLSANTSSELPAGYAIQVGYPAISDYLNLRAASGLTPKNEAQARMIPTGSWYGCYVTFTAEDGTESTVAMGRIIGDGGWYFHIADMAVLPQHQRKGLGDAILKDLLARIKAQAPEGEPYVTLFADPPGRKLYAQNGFVDAAPKQLGMQLPKGW
jgi:GNAT superfamily N-acetyltransferase